MQLCSLQVYEGHGIHGANCCATFDTALGSGADTDAKGSVSIGSVAARILSLDLNRNVCPMVWSATAPQTLMRAALGLSATSAGAADHCSAIMV